jgi:hypothetical protein
MTDNQMLIGQYDNTGLFVLISLFSLLGVVYIVYPPFTFWVDCLIERFKNWMK